MWVQIPASAKPRRKTGGEDNHGGKSSLVCELVGPIDGIFYIDLVWAYPLRTNINIPIAPPLLPSTHPEFINS